MIPLPQRPGLPPRTNTMPGRPRSPSRERRPLRVRRAHDPAGRAAVGEEAVHRSARSAVPRSADAVERRQALQPLGDARAAPARRSRRSPRRRCAARRARGTAVPPTRPRRPAARSACRGHSTYDPACDGGCRRAPVGSCEHEPLVSDLERLDRDLVVLGVERRALPLRRPALAELPRQRRLARLVEQRGWCRDLRSVWPSITSLRHSQSSSSSRCSRASG